MTIKAVQAGPDLQEHEAFVSVSWDMVSITSEHGWLNHVHFTLFFIRGFVHLEL